MLQKECAQRVHVGSIAKPHLRTQARAHVILCSSALDLASVLLVDY